MRSEGFGFDAGEGVDGDVASQLPAFTGQAAGLQAGCLSSVEFFDDVREEQDLLRLNADGFLDIGVRLRLTLGPRRRVEVTTEQRCQIPASEQPKISFCA